MTYSLHITYNDTLVAYKPLENDHLLRQIMVYHRLALVTHGAAIADIHIARFDASGEKITGSRSNGTDVLPPLSSAIERRIERAVELQLDDSFYGSIVMKTLEML